jgi:hypothetical protein
LVLEELLVLPRRFFLPLPRPDLLEDSMGAEVKLHEVAVVAQLLTEVSAFFFKLLSESRRVGIVMAAAMVVVVDVVDPWW